jgi:hypothetical protein
MIPSNVLPIARRALFLFFAISLVVLPACSKKSAQEKAVDSAVKQYARVSSGMSKKEVVALLGEPTKILETAYRWEIFANSESNASLELQFDTADRVGKITESYAHRN